MCILNPGEYLFFPAHTCLFRLFVDTPPSGLSNSFVHTYIYSYSSRRHLLSPPLAFRKPVCSAAQLYKRKSRGPAASQPILTDSPLHPPTPPHLRSPPLLTIQACHPSLQLRAVPDLDLIYMTGSCIRVHTAHSLPLRPLSQYSHRQLRHFSPSLHRDSLVQIASLRMRPSLRVLSCLSGCFPGMVEDAGSG